MNHVQSSILAKLYTKSYIGAKMQCHIHIRTQGPVLNTIDIYTPQKFLPAHRLGRVEALHGLCLLEGLHGEGSAPLRASRLFNTREPDLPALTIGTRASLEANVAGKTASGEDEVAIVVDLEGTALLVLADRLDTGGIADVALAHAAAVDVELERGVEGVDVDAAGILVEREGGVVDAAGDILTVAVDGTGLVVLGGRVDDKAALAGLNIAILNLGAAAQGHQAEDVAGLRARESRRGLGQGGGDGSHGGSGGGSGELHFDSLDVMLLKCGIGDCRVEMMG